MMSLPIVRTASVMAIALAVILAFAAPALTETPPQNAVSSDHEEGFSADDVKDVFEANQFIMFSVGIGAALYWFCYYYLPSQELPRIEFEVEIERVGENDMAWMIELVALVKNRGGKKAELTELRFAVESVHDDCLSTQGGSLVDLNALTPLFTGEWVPARLAVDAGTRTRRSIAVAIPKTVDQVVVTAQMRNVKRAEVYDASRLVRLSRMPRSGFVH